MRRKAPLWIISLALVPFGAVGGLIAVSFPQLLVRRGLPGAQVAMLTALALSPAFWGFLLSPILDVRFSHRTYAASSLVMSAVLITIVLLIIKDANIYVFAAILLVSTTSAVLMQSAVGGWFSNVIDRDDKRKLSAWMMVANLGGAGVAALAVVPLTMAIGHIAAAFVIGAALLASLAVYPLIPREAPKLDEHRVTLGGVFRDVRTVLARQESLIVLFMLLLPVAPFALTNVLGGLGSHFGASEREVSVIAGLGLSIAGAVGSLILPSLAKIIQARKLYLIIGFVGALFTLSLLLLERTPTTLAIAFVGERLFQALSFTCAFAMVFDLIGEKNNTSATIFSFFIGVSNLSVTYMVYGDGQVFQAFGINGGFIFDAACSLVAVAVVVLGLSGARWRSVTRRGGERDVGPHV